MSERGRLSESAGSSAVVSRPVNSRTRQPRRPRYTPYIALNKYVSGTRHAVWRDYLPIFTDVGGVFQ